MRALIFLCCLLFAAAVAPPALAHGERLAGGEWVLSGDTGSDAPTLRFEAGRVAGKGGCNRFGGRYEERGQDLRFSPLAATRMACAAEAMRKEHAFFGMLEKVRGFTLSGDTLTLLDEAGKALAAFTRRLAD